MLLYGLGLGALLVVVGLITYWLAPKVGPNPWFGARTGYSVASREVWDATNRATGLGMAACGLVEALLGFMLSFLPVDQNTAGSILVGWMILSILAVSGWSMLYSRRLAQKTQLARDLRPVAFRWVYVTPALASAALFLAYAIYLYPQLPATHLATHFDLAGKANGWMDRNEFYVFFLGLGLLLTLLDVVVVFWATREPLIAIDRLGSSWWMSPERGLIFLGIIMAFLNLMFAVLLWETARVNIQGAQTLSVGTVWGIALAILVVTVAGFFLLAQRRSVS